MNPPLPQPSAVRRILVIHAGTLGDMILTLRPVSCLQKHYPEASIECLSRHRIGKWLAGRSDIRRWHDYETSSVGELFREDQSGSVFAEFLADFDLVVTFTGDESAAHVSAMRRMAPGQVVAVEPNPREPVRHVTDQWLADMRLPAECHLPLNTRLIRPHNADRDRWRSELLHRVGGGDGPVAILHPGSGGQDKCWPIEHFEELARLLRSQGAAPVFMVGPVELDVHGPPMIRRLQNQAPVVCEESVEKAAGAVVAGDTFVGNDAGMTHLAGAAGVPTIVVFGPTDPAVWHPPGPHVICIAPPGLAPAAEISFDRIAGELRF